MHESLKIHITCSSINSTGTQNVSLVETREYWMIYREPGVLAVVFLFFSVFCVSPVELTDKRGGGGWSQIIRRRERQVIYRL